MAKGLWRNRWAEFGQIGTERLYACVTARSSGRWEWSLMASDSPYEEGTVAEGKEDSEDAALSSAERAAEQYASAAESEALDAADEALGRAAGAKLGKSMVLAYARDRAAREAAE